MERKIEASDSDLELLNPKALENSWMKNEARLAKDLLYYSNIIPKEWNNFKVFIDRTIDWTPNVLLVRAVWLKLCYCEQVGDFPDQSLSQAGKSAFIEDSDSHIDCVRSNDYVVDTAFTQQNDRTLAYNEKPLISHVSFKDVTKYCNSFDDYKASSKTNEENVAFFSSSPVKDSFANREKKRSMHFNYSNSFMNSYVEKNIPLTQNETTNDSIVSARAGILNNMNEDSESSGKKTSSYIVKNWTPAKDSSLTSEKEKDDHSSEKDRRKKKPIKEKTSSVLSQTENDNSLLEGCNLPRTDIIIYKKKKKKDSMYGSESAVIISSTTENNFSFSKNSYTPSKDWANDKRKKRKKKNRHLEDENESTYSSLSDVDLPSDRSSSQNTIISKKKKLHLSYENNSTLNDSSVEQNERFSSQSSFPPTDIIYKKKKKSKEKSGHKEEILSHFSGYEENYDCQSDTSSNRNLIKKKKKKKHCLSDETVEDYSSPVNTNLHQSDETICTLPQGSSHLTVKGSIIHKKRREKLVSGDEMETVSSISSQNENVSLDYSNSEACNSGKKKKKKRKDYERCDLSSKYSDHGTEERVPPLNCVVSDIQVDNTHVKKKKRKHQDLSYDESGDIHNEPYYEKPMRKNKNNSCEENELLEAEVRKKKKKKGMSTDQGDMYFSSECNSEEPSTSYVSDSRKNEKGSLPDESNSSSPDSKSRSRKRMSGSIKVKQKDILSAVSKACFNKTDIKKKLSDKLNDVNAETILKDLLMDKFKECILPQAIKNIKNALNWDS